MNKKIIVFGKEFDFGERKKSKDKYWKLKQLDRIEYSLHAQEIKNRYRYWTLTIIGGFLTLWFMLLSVFLLMYLFNESMFLDYAKYLPYVPIFSYVRLAIMLALVIDVLTFFRKRADFKFLNKKFKLGK